MDAFMRQWPTNNGVGAGVLGRRTGWNSKLGEGSSACNRYFSRGALDIFARARGTPYCGMGRRIARPGLGGGLGSSRVQSGHLAFQVWDFLLVFFLRTCHFAQA